jgi:CheY-like chemotaxis protein
MPDTKARLLIVDDDPSIRMSLSQVLTEIGYSVRSSADSFAALAEIRREAPDIVISDLNMPGMSGFELLPVVRRRFPRIKAIAMSGAFSGNEVPLNVTADAFYPKGGSFLYLIGILESLTPLERTEPMPAEVLPPIWIARNGHNAAGEAYVTIECPGCMRNFPQILSGTIGSTCETDCVFCGALVRYAIVHPADRAPVMPLEHRQSSAKPRHRFLRKHERKAATVSR